MESQEPVLGVLREELQALARDDGLVPAKLEGARILALISPSSGLTPRMASQVLVTLIVDVVGELRDEKERAAARATLNVGSPSTRDRTAKARQSALAAQRHTHPDTVRRWWRRAANALAPMLFDRIEELNRTPSAWRSYALKDRGASGDVTDNLPNYHFDQVDMVWRLQGRRAVELITFRRLVAHVDGIDRVKAKGWYFSDPSPDACRVEPLLNCTMASSRHVGRGIQLAELVFAAPLRQGQEVFYGYRVVVRSSKDVDTLFYHHVASAGVRKLDFHIQFDPAEPPAVAWKFATNDDAEPMIPPPHESDAYLGSPNRVGYTHLRFSEVPHGIKCGIAWAWTRSAPSVEG